MARRIRWQIVIALVSALVIAGLLGSLALSTASIARPVAGGDYVEGIIGAPPSRINPLLDDQQSNPTGYDLATLIFDGLTRIGADGMPEPALARSWSIDETGTVYTFQIRNDAKWHDGSQVTADDVIFTIRSIQSRDFVGDSSLAGLWRAVLVDKIDDFTIRCTLNAPYAPFLSAARLPILPAHLLQDVPLSEWATMDFNRAPIGSGPYRLKELSERSALLEANSDYYAQRPLIDTLELRFFTSPETALSALDRAEIQGLGYSPLQVLRGIRLPATTLAYALPMDGYTTLTFNLRNEKLQDEVLRRALAQGLDKNAIIEQNLAGQAQRLDTPILPGWWAYDPQARWYAFDPNAALRALTELGYTDADGSNQLALTLITDSANDHIEVAQAIAAQWGEIGVAVTVEQLDAAGLRTRLREHDFEVAIHSFSGLGPDPDIFELWHSTQADLGLNYAGLQDDALDRLIEAGRIENDLVLRADEYHAFQRRWIELVPAITLYQPLYVYAATPKLGGLGFTNTQLASSALIFGQSDRYRNVNRWFINSSREIQGDLRQQP
jgi:ABC-type dipeptide transport system, periplasmic component